MWSSDMHSTRCCTTYHWIDLLVCKSSQKATLISCYLVTRIPLRTMVLLHASSECTMLIFLSLMFLIPIFFISRELWKEYIVFSDMHSYIRLQGKNLLLLHQSKWISISSCTRTVVALMPLTVESSRLGSISKIQVHQGGPQESWEETRVESKSG